MATQCSWPPRRPPVGLALRGCLRWSLAYRGLLRNLVSYLKQKQAAGVISLPVGGSKGRDSTGMLYAFPPCDFSQQYLQSALRTLGKLEEEHMVIVIVRDTA